MRRSSLTRCFSLGAALAAALFAFAVRGATPQPQPAKAAAQPAAAARPYHLQLEANPALPFPFLEKFGTIAIHVYPGGVRAESTGLTAFSRNGDKTITAANGLTRMYTEVPIDDVSGLLGKLGGLSNNKIYAAIASLQPPVADKVNGLDAMRHRLSYSPNAWIDVWTTRAIPDNAQAKRIVTELVYNLSPGTGAMLRSIPGMPLQVELNFTSYRKLQLVRLKSLTFDNKGEAEALAVDPAFTKVPAIESVWK